MKKQKIEVIFAGAELAPLVKVGGLGDVMGSLPIALSKLGVEVKVFIPFYGSINRRKFGAKLVKKNIQIEMECSPHKFDLYQSKLPGSQVKVFLVKHKMFDMKNVYVGNRKYFEKGKYSSKKGCYSRGHDDVERFVFFSKAVVETIKTMKWKPNVVHAHDWHAALIPTFIDEYSLENKNFDNIKSLYTIHNLANQGITSLDIVDYAGLHQNLTPALMEDYHDQDGLKIDSMKVGILSADLVNTVSPNYAKEILTKEYGAGLEKYLQRRQKHLHGILNGIDLKLFDPAKDKNIKKKYSLKNFEIGKKINKEELQKLSKLPVEDKPLLGLISRLVWQKGLDILLPALETLLKKYDFQVVVLGTGQKKFEKGFQDLVKQYPNKVTANITFSLPLAQKIYAGSDFFLIPSRFEPCGLGQMISMRYGTPPIARATGGLKDTVENNKTGVVFKKYTQKEMKSAIERSLRIYKNKAKMNKMIRVAMKKDFSWDSSAKDYLKLYKKLS
ncbi:glycogen synthase [bacterium]|nr:glycogen synthase [bacterium]